MHHNCACGTAALVAQGSLLESQVEPVVTAVNPRGDVVFAKRLRRLQPHQVIQGLVAAIVRWSRSFGLAGASIWRQKAS